MVWAAMYCGHVMHCVTIGGIVWVVCAVWQRVGTGEAAVVCGSGWCSGSAAVLWHVGSVCYGRRRGVVNPPPQTRVAIRTCTPSLFSCRHFELNGHDHWLGLSLKNSKVVFWVSNSASLRERHHQNTLTLLFGAGAGMHWKKGGAPSPGRPAYAQPLSP